MTILRLDCYIYYQMAGHHTLGPRAYLEDRPTAQSIKLGGRFINAKNLAEGEGLCHSHVTRVLNGDRPCSVEYLQKLASALLMSVDDLLEAIHDRKTDRSYQAARRLGLTA